MPRGDGTGPMGMGPMTGRGVGFCAGVATPGYMNPTPGYGFGFGRGRGYRRMRYLTGMPGWARYDYPVFSEGIAPEVEEKEFLNDQAEFLENQLLQVKQRLKKFNDENE